MKEEDLLQGWQICVDCKGRKYSACPKCKGKGTNEKLIGEYFEQVPCKRCDNGKIYCETCGGLGAYSKPK